MVEIPTAFLDFALILTVAGIVAVFSRALKLPTLFGYVLAGFLLSREVKFFPTPLSFENINVWAQYGIVFFLFYLGLEFSFRKLVERGPSSFFIAALEMSIVMCGGYYLGRAMGWAPVESVFLGSVLSISSTTLVLRMLEDRGLKETQWAQGVFSILIIEDIYAVLMLVALSTIAVSQKFSGSELVFPLVKFVFFLSIWFLLGIALIPTFLRRFSDHLSDELLTIVSVGLCFVMVVVAHKVGLSEAMGAFVMGSMLSETPFSGRIRKLITPFKDVFGGIFFIWVGLQIKTDAIVDSPGLIVGLVVTVLMGKFLGVSLSGIAAGWPIRHSLLSGATLAQIGEFSFVVAGLGASLKVVDQKVVSYVAVASLVTSFVAPLMVKFISDYKKPIRFFLNPNFVKYLTAYRLYISRSAPTTEWKSWIKDQFMYLFLSICWILFCVVFLGEWIVTRFDMSGFPVAFMKLLAELFMSSPALWFVGVEIFKNKKARVFWNSLFQYRVYLSVFVALRVGLLVAALTFMVSQSWGMERSVLGAIVGFVLMIFFLSTYLEKLFGKLLKLFQDNTQSQAQSGAPSDPFLLTLKNASPDFGLVPFEVQRNALMIGQSLAQLKIREQFGISVVRVDREGKSLFSPPGDLKVLGGDVLHLIGSDEQISKFKDQLNCSDKVAAFKFEVGSQVSLEKYRVTPKSRLVNKSIKDSGIKEIANAFVVGVDRSEERISNPASQFVFKENDYVWIAGHKKKIKKYLSSK